MGRVRHPVGEQDGLVFRKVAIVEHQQKLATVGIQTLNGMWNAGGEIPKIAFRDVADKTLAVGIKAGDASVSVEHDGPLGSGVPVQLSYAPGGQSHVDTGDRLGDRKLAHCDLARPSTLL